ncbi:hypothetical protein ACFWZ3_03090 [Frateuria sp. GZRR35]|uniref:hypothetical protein n=1 Tax=Frateuria sp. GZRR35 TaxID=3351536 RepID=UPI003EDBD8E9
MAEADFQRELQMQVGATVLVCQEAERYLKALLPFMDSTLPSLAEALDRLGKLKRHPFGPLTEQFMDRSLSISDGIREQLAGLVNKRNNIVHHFTETYGAELRAGKHQQVLADLRTTFANLATLRNALAEAVAFLLEAIRDTVFTNTPEYEQMRELCASFRQALETRPDRSLA